MLISLKWNLIFFHLYFVCTCFARDYSDTPGDDVVDQTILSGHGFDRNYGFVMNGMSPTDIQSRMMSTMMLHYVMSKGCDYINAFVKGHYYKHWSSSVDHSHIQDNNYHKTCDWKPWMERTCGLYHVPMELCCALMDCGASRSLEALGAPHEMIEQCNMTDAVMAIHDIGKRDNHINIDPPSTSRMCSHIQAFIFGKRDDNTNTEHMAKQLQLNNHTTFDRLSTSNFRNVSAKPESNMSGRQPKHIKKWCKVFSRNVSKKYHLKESRFVRRSAYWLVDIYKVAVQHHVPNYYTHGLVGCGIDYAMRAFNVEKWQTVLYKLASK